MTAIFKTGSPSLLLSLFKQFGHPIPIQLYRRTQQFSVYIKYQQINGVQFVLGNQQIQFNKISMQKTITTSSYDVIVIRHKNQTLKSTPFQAVFSEKTIKMRQNKKVKLKDLQLLINDEVVDVPIRIDIANGRVQFRKRFIKRPNLSDNSDASDDDRSQRSTSREKRLSNTLNGESIKELTNEQAPKNFWQFAWLFNSKKGDPPQKSAKPVEQQSEQSNLARINEQPYEGEQSSKQPLFQLSICGHLFAKKKDNTLKQELQKIFYQHKVEYRDFMKDPLAILSDTNLIVRIDNSFYSWQLGAAVLACKFAYGEMPDKLVDVIKEKEKSKSRWFGIFGRDTVTKLDIEKEPPLIQAPMKNDEQEIIRYRKTPDSQILEKMKLRQGENKAKFVLETTPGVYEENEFRIFLWDQNQKIIVSDIDGTITRSDVMGQLKTNYIHKGVCLLYNQLYKRNYKMLYMTARAIGQYNQTRKFLDKQAQQNGFKLPPGPLLMSPDGYLKSFAREVIQKAPDQLKIKLLASVNEIFPNTKKPIIAGFGNRETDSIAYLRIQIPQDKIFYVTQKSVVTIYSKQQFQTSYVQLLQKVQNYFPVYVKPEYSEISHLSKSQQKEIGIDQNQQQALVNHRKMSHSQFYEYSPTSSEKNNNLSLSSKTRSQDGNPNDINADFQTLVQDYMLTFKIEEEKKKEQ